MRVLFCLTLLMLPACLNNRTLAAQDGIQDAVIVHPPSRVGSVVLQNENTRFCPINAAAARDFSGRGSVEATAEALRNLDVEARGRFLSTNQLLINRDQAATFTEVALTHLCALTVTGNLTNDQVLEAYTHTLDTARTLPQPPQTQTSSN